MSIAGFLTKLVGGGIIDAAGGVADIIDRFVETEEERKAADLLLLKAQQEPDKWQALTNQLEAQHRSIFVAGWRPMIGWICASALAWGWIIGPVVQFIYPDRTLPAIEIGQAISLIMAMLGMGALRSYEKSKGLSE